MDLEAVEALRERWKRVGKSAAVRHELTLLSANPGYARVIIHTDMGCQLVALLADLILAELCLRDEIESWVSKN